MRAREAWEVIFVDELLFRHAIPACVSQDRFDLGRKQLDVYFGGILVRASPFEPEELRHLRHEATEIRPEVFRSVFEVAWYDEACLELGVNNSCPLKLADKSDRGSATNISLVNRKIGLTKS